MLRILRHNGSARRRRLGFLAGTLATICLLVAGAPAAHAYPGPPSSIFDPKVTDTRFVFDRTATQWAADFDRLTGQGFMVLDLEVHNHGGVRYGAIFQRRPSGLRWRSLRDMPRDRYLNELTKAHHDGLRVADIEIYQNSSGADRYAVVWVERVGNENTQLIGGTKAQMAGLISRERGNGRMPVDIEEYSTAGCAHCYITIWADNVENLNWQIAYGLTDSQFAAKFEQYRDSYRMVAVQSSIHIDGDFPDPDDAWNEYSGIWVQDPKHRGWAERRDMTAETFAQRRNEYAAAGYRPLAFEQYPRKKTCTVLGGCILTITYAMIWRQNT